MATVAGSQIVGIGSTSTVVSADFIPQVAMHLENYGRESRPIFSVMAKLGLIEDATNTLVQWMEIQFDEPSVNSETQISGAGAGTTFTTILDTLAVVAGDRFQEPVSNQLFECVSITSYDTTNVKTTAVFRKRPSTSAIASATANAMFMRMGNSKIEGGRFKDPTTKSPLRLSNTLTEITQQVKVSKEVERLWRYSGMSTFEMDLQNVQDQINHDIERSILFGKSYEESATITRSSGAESGTVRSAQGVWDRIQSKRVPYSGSLTELGLDNFCSSYLFGDVFGGGSVKLGFHGNLVPLDIATFVKNRYRKLDSGNEYGCEIKEYISPVEGTIYLIAERQFFPTFGSWSNTNGTSDGPYANTLLFLDPAYFMMYKLYEGLMMVQDASPKDQSQKAIGIDAVFSPVLKNERFHGIYSHTV